MNYGIVDIGSNTIRLNVYQVKSKDDFSVLFSNKYQAGLASYVVDGNLSTKGINVLRNAIKETKSIFSISKLDKIYYFATASLRKVHNSNIILSDIKNDFGINIELISDKDEAKLGFLGVNLIYPKSEGINIDIGGGSTEIVVFKNRKPDKIYNLDEGGLSLYTQFVKGIIPKKKEIKKMRQFISEKLKSLNINKENKFDEIVGVGGTLRACGSICSEIWEFKNDEAIDIVYLEAIINRIEDKDMEMISTIFKIKPSRIHTLIPGLVIFLEVAKLFNIKKLYVSSNGVREGFLVSKLEKNHENK
ncbi:MAG: phosphatase [Peptoniphilaceae bacterium]|nr:phosphatase [Peptoniphilaceae bacterium]MDD7383126.1 phosphatase [Peptoniphilaceae bacterium]MDY3738372.1 phosphatase [Peptoniphilaceae bacterium]